MTLIPKLSMIIITNMPNIYNNLLKYKNIFLFNNNIKC